MASCTALATHPLLSQNIPGQQTTSGFRVCQGLLFNDIPEFLNASPCILLFRNSIHEALTTPVVVLDLQHVLWAQVITIPFDIMTNVFVLMICFPWKGKCVRENCTDFFSCFKTTWIPLHLRYRRYSKQHFEGTQNCKLFKTIFLSWKFWMRSLANLYPMGYKKIMF